MAKMYPSSKELIVEKRRAAGLPVQNDMGFDGEMRVYDCLSGCPRNWVVIYSCWFQEDSLGINKEADFVVLVPGKGLMVLEVKNRALRLQDGIWRAHDGVEVDAAGQAYVAAKNLVSLLASKGIVSSQNDRYAPALEYRRLGILLGLARPQEPMVNPEAYVFDEELPDLRSKIERCFQWNYGLTEATIAEIRKTLLESYRFKISSSSMLKVIETKAARISGMLAAMSGSTNGIWVEGCAGSGKTVMAVNEIVRLVGKGAQNPPRILYTCYTNRLADAVREQIQDKLKSMKLKTDTVHVTTLYKHIYFHIGTFGMENNCINDADVDRFLAAVRDNDGAKYDYIFVDEAQDNGSDMQLWSVLSALLRRPDDWNLQRPYQNMYVFADSNQRLYNAAAAGQTYMPDISTRVVLQANLRNPGNIGRCAALAFGDDLQLDYLDLPGSIVLKEGADTAEDRAAIVNSIITEVLEKYEAEDEDIVVLSPLAAEYSRPGQPDANAAERSLRILRDSYGYPDAQLSTIKNFKGLEAPFVILTDIPGKGAKPEWGYNPDDFYVACTRAKVALYIVPILKGYEELRECIAPLEEEGRAYNR